MSALADVVEQALPQLRAVSEQRAHTRGIGADEMVTSGSVSDRYSRRQLRRLAQVRERAQA